MSKPTPTTCWGFCMFMMGWKTIEIENGQNLSLFLDNLVIMSDDNKITIPLNDIDVLLINNFKIKITIQLINALTENNIVTIICNNNYLPQSIIVPVIGNWNTLKVLDSQLNWNHIYKSKLWKSIIKQKILNQSEFLKKIVLNKDAADKLLELSNELKDYDITNREGHASKIYWHSLFGINFKRFNDDYWNSLLNYGYTILRGYMTRSIIKKGLDPRIAIFHKSYHNYFSLASDLMEPFRVLIDYEVYKIYENGEIDFYNHKTELIKCFNKKILVNGRKQFVNNAIDLFVDSVVQQNDLCEIKLDYESL